MSLLELKSLKISYLHHFSLNWKNYLVSRKKKNVPLFFKLEMKLDQVRSVQPIYIEHLLCTRAPTMQETKQIKPLPCGAYARTISILFLQLNISLLIDLRNIAYRSIRGKALFIDGNEKGPQNQEFQHYISCWAFQTSC